MIITRKIQIACKNKEQYPILQEMLKTCRLMSNKVMTHFYSSYQEMLDNKPEEQSTGDYFKDKFQCSFQNSGYRYLRDRFPDSNSYFCRDIGKMVYDSFRADLKNGLLKGDRSVRSYRNGVIPIHNADVKLTERLTKEEIIFKWIKKIDFALVFGKDRSNNKEIVDRIIRGIYKPSGSIIFKDWRKGKWFLLLCVNLPEQNNDLLEDVSVGVDLGVAVPAVCALNKGKQRAFIGNSILLKRFDMQRAYRKKQRSYIPDNSEHGRQKTNKAIHRVGDKERRFVNSFNHKITKRIITFALKHKAATILIEDLSSFKERNIGNDVVEDKILRNWSFHELQSMLEYKAKQQKIKVVKVPAAYTSQACNKCGYIDKENRKERAKFKCLQCGFEEHADYNAACNIALGGVSSLKKR